MPSLRARTTELTSDFARTFSKNAYAAPHIVLGNVSPFESSKRSRLRLSTVNEIARFSRDARESTLRTRTRLAQGALVAKRPGRSRFPLISIATHQTYPNVSSATRNDHEESRWCISPPISPSIPRAAEVFMVLLSRPTLLTLLPYIALSLSLSRSLDLSYSGSSWTNNGHIEGLTLKG